MGLFGGRRATDPSSWDELWEVLAPLGGRLTPEAVARWEDVVAASPPAFLEAASVQLGHAYRLLGTEAHARELGPGAFAGVGRPFAARRFGRVVDAVVVAGPDAVARVAGDPAAIRSYAATVPLLDPVLAYHEDGQVPLGVELMRLHDRARFERGGELRAPKQSRRPVTAAGDLDKDALRAWPSLAGRRAGAVWRGIRDPELPWLDVDASMLDESPGGAEPVRGGPAVVDGPGTWYACGLSAAEQVYTALGSGALGDLVRTVAVGVDVRDADRTADGAGDGEVDDADGDDELLVLALVEPADAATTSPDARVAVLVRSCARRLLDVPFVATPANRPALERLAHR